MRTNFYPTPMAERRDPPSFLNWRMVGLRSTSSIPTISPTLTSVMKHVFGNDSDTKTHST